MSCAKNLCLILLNLGILALALPLVEYDVSKTLHPQSNWLPTHSALDLILLSVASILAIYHLSVMMFVVFRRLDGYRRWLWRSTIVVLALVCVVIALQGRNFLAIYLP